MAAVTPRQLWQDAVWADADLTTHERLVALAFAKMAGRGIDSVWVDRNHLVALTHMSRSQAIRCVSSLDHLGWLVRVREARQHYSPRYRLAIPSTHQESTSDTPGQLRGVPQASRGPHQDAQGSAPATRITRTTIPNPSCEICDRTESRCRLMNSRLQPADQHDFTPTITNIEGTGT